MATTLDRSPATAAVFSKTNSAPIEERPLFDVRSIGQTVYRNLGLIALAVIVFVALALLYLMFAPRKYEATSRIEVSAPSAPVVGTSTNIPTEDSREFDRTLQTQIDLLQTRQMASRVLTKMKRDKEHAAMVANLTPDELKGMLAVLLPRNSRIIPITVTDSMPERASVIANTYAKTLIESNLTTRTTSLAYARDYLADQLEKARGELESSKQASIGYARQAGIVDASEGSTTGQGTSSLTTTSLLQLNSSYAQAKADRIRAQQRWEQAQSTPVLSLPEVISNSAVQGLLQQKAVLQAKLSEDRQRYGESYPSVVQQKANIAELDDEVGRLANNVRNSLRDEYRTALQQENALAQNVGVAKGQTLAEQARGVRYDILQREGDTNQALYDALLQRYKEVTAEIGIGDNNIALVDPASPDSDAVSPDAGKALAIAIALGLIAGLAATFLRSQLDGRIYDANAFSRTIGLPVIGHFPVISRGHDLSAELADPSSEYARAGATLLSRLELGTRGAIPRTLCITSCGSAMAQSAVAISLAEAAIRSGRSVLLIGNDTGLGGPVGKGLMDLISGVPLSGAVQRSSHFNGDVLPLGEFDIGNEIARIEKVKDVLEYASSGYETVLIDAPSLSENLQALRLASLAEGSILVFENSVSKRDDVVACADILQSSANPIGTVVMERKPSRIASVIAPRVRTGAIPVPQV